MASLWEPTPRQNLPASPRRSATASVTASSAFRPANSVLIWNVRASPRRTRSCGPSVGDVLAAEKNLPGIGRQHAGHQIDERGLAGAVRTDQRIARADRQIDLDIARDRQRAEGFRQSAGR